jgi:signal transduction histidine kinase
MKAFNKISKKDKEIETLKDEFLSSVSHEFKSPLSAIEGYTDLLIYEAEKDSFKEKQQLKGLNIIKKSLSSRSAKISALVPARQHENVESSFFQSMGAASALYQSTSGSAL